MAAVHPFRHATAFVRPLSPARTAHGRVLKVKQQQQ
jgi:hypothetical protein